MVRASNPVRRGLPNHCTTVLQAAETAKIYTMYIEKYYQLIKSYPNIQKKANRKENGVTLTASKME